MLVNTEAVILKVFAYGDTSLVVRCFTREMGKLSLIARGARSRKSPLSAYLMPVHYLELVFYYKATRELQLLSKVAFLANWSRILEDLKKIVYAQALVELTDRVLSVQDPHADLFRCLVGTLQVLNDRREHLNLLFWYYQLQVLRLLGYQPDFANRVYPGVTLPDPAGGPASLSLMQQLLETEPESIPEHQVSTRDRKVISEYLNAQIRYHFEIIGELQSLKVLKQIMS